MLAETPSPGFPRTSDLQSAAQRISDLAELEMMVIRESMARVNGALSSVRRSYIRRPARLRSLAARIRSESRIQEESAAQVEVLIGMLGSMRSDISSAPRPHPWNALGASLVARMSDLDSGLRSRETAMEAARSAPRSWLENCRRLKVCRLKIWEKLLGSAWKSFAIAGSAVFVLLLLSGPGGNSAMSMSAGLLFLCSALANTAHYRAARRLRRVS